MQSTKLLGELLLEEGLISQNDLEQAINIQEQTSSRIGAILVQIGAISEANLIPVIATQLGVPTLKQWHVLKNSFQDITATSKYYDLEKNWWQTHKSFPLGEYQDALWVAQLDVLDDFLAKVLQDKVNKPIKKVLVTAHELRQLMAQVDDESKQFQIDQDYIKNVTTAAPVIQFVNDTIYRAVEAKASDIHFEPYQDIFRVRFRVDGVLHEVDQPGPEMHAEIISRLKLMASLDISEKRIPQDGRIRMRVSGKELDIRVAVSPGIAGESVVLRLLSRDQGVSSLEQLGMHEDHYQQTQQLLSHSNGILLVTGPTGSGKTTSLYAFLKKLSNNETKIITVEDPVEYQMSGISQIPVNPEVGLGFAESLRSVLRQDPDVVLIGEIRDKETASIAVQASLTGHLVLSTLHTNDAASSFVRLMDIGVENYLLASSVIGVLAQRLVRKVCPHCMVSDKTGHELALSYGWEAIKTLWPDLITRENFVYGKGCQHCMNSGYIGRTAIYEVITVDEELRHLISTQPENIKSFVQQKKLRSLLQDGLIYASQGETTVAEVLRIAG